MSICTVRTVRSAKLALLNSKDRISVIMLSATSTARTVALALHIDSSVA